MPAAVFEYSYTCIQIGHGTSWHFESFAKVAMAIEQTLLMAPKFVISDILLGSIPVGRFNSDVALVLNIDSALDEEFRLGIQLPLHCHILWVQWAWNLGRVRNRKFLSRRIPHDPD